MLIYEKLIIFTNRLEHFLLLNYNMIQGKHGEVGRHGLYKKYLIG